MSSITPKTFWLRDSSNELYPFLVPATWSGPPIPKTCSIDTTSYRHIIISLLDCLLLNDSQYRHQFAECLGTAYDQSEVRISEVYRHDKFHHVLSYRVFAVTDTVNKGFYCFTHYQDFSFRPLFKEYELFLINRLLAEPGVLKKEYYRNSFLLAIQRTCYLWFIKIAECFEMKGSLCIPVRWAHSKEKKDHYDLFTARIEIEFDRTECFKGDQSSMSSVIDMKISAPFAFHRSKIEKKRFEDDQAFYDELWDLRIAEIKKTLGDKYESLICTEKIGTN